MFHLPLSAECSNLPQIPGYFYLDPIGIARIILQGDILHINNFYGLPDSSGFHSQVHSLGFGRFQGLLTGGNQIIHQFFVIT